MRSGYLICIYIIIIVGFISLIDMLLPAISLGAENVQKTTRELANIHYDRARDYYGDREYAPAKAEFEEVLRLEPDHQGARWYLKLTEKLLSQYEKTFRGNAQKLKTKRLLKKDEDAQSRYHRIKDALDVIEEHSEPSPKAATEKTLVTLPRLPETAIAPAKITIPDSPSRLLDATTATLLQERPGDTGELSQAQEYYQKGKMHLERGQYAEAMQYFDKVIELGGEPQ
ncbi:MAG: tetratricopeptide repeat protein [Candidatus Omnitrophota bacterium]